MSCHHLENALLLTTLETNAGLLVRIVLIVRNTSTICSALNLLILITSAQNVPEHSTPSLHEYVCVVPGLVKQYVPAVYCYWSIASFTLDMLQHFNHVNNRNRTG